MNRKLVFLGASVAIVLLQILYLRVQVRDPEFYKFLCQLDCEHFATIAQYGYNSGVAETELYETVRLPFYPLLIRGVHSLVSWDWEECAVLVSHVGAALSYFFLFLVCSALGFSLRATGLVVGSLIAHPANIYLLNGYSESVFIPLLLLFVYSLVTEAPFRASVTAVGLVFARTMSAFSILLPAFLCRRKWQAVVTTLSVVAAGVAYLWFSKQTFGSSTAYADTFAQFNVRFRPETFFQALFHVSAPTSMRNLGALAFPLTTFLLLCWLSLEIKFPARDRFFRAGFFLGSFTFIFVPTVSFFLLTAQFLWRYAFPSHLLLVLGFAAFVNQESLTTSFRSRLGQIALVFLVLFFVLNLKLQRDYALRIWTG